MNNKTIQNLVDNIVLEKIKGYYYVELDIIKDMFKPLCDNSEDLTQILCCVSFSNKYNCVIKQNGEGYVFSNKKRDVIAFLEDVKIGDNELAWFDFIQYGDRTMLLREVYEEVK